MPFLHKNYFELRQSRMNRYRKKLLRISLIWLKAESTKRTEKNSVVIILSSGPGEKKSAPHPK